MFVLLIINKRGNRTSTIKIIEYLLLFSIIMCLRLEYGMSTVDCGPELKSFDLLLRNNIPKIFYSEEGSMSNVTDPNSEVLPARFTTEQKILNYELYVECWISREISCIKR